MAAGAVATPRPVLPEPTKANEGFNMKSPLVRGVKLWEMLPEKVQKVTTKVKFKSLVKQICKT